MNSSNRRNKYDNKDCLEIGNKAEELFLRILDSKGFSYQKSNQNQDINEHWDYLIEKDGISWKVEVKARKRIQRTDKNVQDDWIWIELHGVRPDDRGWLYGSKADIIAFEMEDSFIIVKRDELIKLVEQVVDFNSQVNSANDARHKIYQRSGRSDKITLIESEKLRTIALAEWKIC